MYVIVAADALAVGTKANSTQTTALSASEASALLTFLARLLRCGCCAFMTLAVPLS
jgi:hypothetical protein